MTKTRSKHKIPRAEYMVAVTRDSRTVYGYGPTLKSAMHDVTDLSIQPGETFTYARFIRASVTVAELTDHNTIRSY